MKATGVRGELLVSEKLISKGWSVAKPIGDGDPYDLLACKEAKSLRIQIKSTLGAHSYKSHPSPHYQFQLAHGLSSKKRYSKEEVDFFICCALDVKRFWIIPFEDATVLTLKIYNGEAGSKFHRYEDAWILLEK